MLILLSNDDGYQARGLRVLAKTLADIAVRRGRRAGSKSQRREQLAHARRAAARRAGRRRTCTTSNGTPTDCVHLAITGLLDDEPDMVISGINHGPNLGDDVLYSGTVAAAMEGSVSRPPRDRNIARCSSDGGAFCNSRRVTPDWCSACCADAAARGYDPERQRARSSARAVAGVLRRGSDTATSPSPS